MSKMNSSELLNAKTIFSKLQHFTFAPFSAAGSASAANKIEDDRGHLDLEAQEIMFKLSNNIQRLSDLSSRVEFMMGELSQIMKKGI